MASENLFGRNQLKPKFIPYERLNHLDPLKLFISIVPFGHASAIIRMLENIGVTCNFITTGEGTGSKFIPGLISAADSKKQIIFSFIREDLIPEVCSTLSKRFSTSKAANGVSFSIKMTSVAGITAYKFLTNTRKATKVK